MSVFLQHVRNDILHVHVLRCTMSPFSTNCLSSTFPTLWRAPFSCVCAVRWNDSTYFHTARTQTSSPLFGRSDASEDETGNSAPSHLITLPGFLHTV